MMADAYLTDQALLAQNPEAADLSRQRKLADMLTSQMFNQPQGNMVSGYYVKPSWTQQLAPLASGIAGQAMNAKLDEKQLKLAEALRTKKDEVIGKINEAIDSGDFKAARLIATKNPEYAKDYIAPLLQNTLPKKTDLIINYEAAKADPVKPFKGSFDEWKNQLTEKDKADLALRQQEVGISGARLNLEQAKAAQELAFGKPLPEGATKQVTGATNLKDAIDNYKTTLKGFSTMDMANPDARANMGNAYNNMMLQAKEAYNLGVLNGPDYQILQSVVKDPTKISSLLVSKNALEKQASDLGTQADKIIENVYKTHNRQVPQTLQPKPQLPVATQQFDPALLPFMTPEQQALFVKPGK